MPTIPTDTAQYYLMELPDIKEFNVPVIGNQVYKGERRAKNLDYSRNFGNTITADKIIVFESINIPYSFWLNGFRQQKKKSLVFSLRYEDNPFRYLEIFVEEGQEKTEPYKTVDDYIIRVGRQHLIPDFYEELRTMPQNLREAINQGYDVFRRNNPGFDYIMESLKEVWSGRPVKRRLSVTHQNLDSRIADTTISTENLVDVLRLVNMAAILSRTGYNPQA
jgi:hypothetical protein